MPKFNKGPEGNHKSLTFGFQIVVNLPGYSQTTRLEQCYYPGAQVASTIPLATQSLSIYAVLLPARPQNTFFVSPGESMKMICR